MSVTASGFRKRKRKGQYWTRPTYYFYELSSFNSRTRSSLSLTLAFQNVDFMHSRALDM